MLLFTLRLQPRFAWLPLREEPLNESFFTKILLNEDSAFDCDLALLGFRSGKSRWLDQAFSCFCLGNFPDIGL